MQKFKLLSAFALSMTLFSPVYAGELRLDYSSFYSHLRKIDDDELRSLQFAFGFLNVRTGGLCTPTSALVHTDKKDIPVSVNQQKRFVLPTEKALKLAKAEVHLELLEANNQCDLSVLLEVKPELLRDGVNSAEMAHYFEAFDAFFDKMGGFLSFMMPSPEGLNLEFRENSEEPQSLTQLQKTQSTNGSYTLMEADISALQSEVSFKDIQSITAFVPGD